MFILWLMLIVNGDPQYHQLKTFETQQDCEEVRGYVEDNMRKEYPDDTTLRVFCRMKSV